MPTTTTTTTVSRKTQVKRTYGSHRNLNTSPVSSSEKASGEVQAGQKRPLTSSFHNNILTPMTKRTKQSVKSNSKSLKKTKQNRKILTQLHFAIDRTILWTCPLCGLSYTKGAIEDESLHRSHCTRVQKGMEWGKEEERESVKIGVVEIANQVEITGGRRGRIISCPAECIGKIGSKISALLQTVYLSLSSPPLTQECLRNSKVYLFLLPYSTIASNCNREKIVGCVVAQCITTAMAIASHELVNANQGNGCSSEDDDNGSKANEASNGDTGRNHLVAVDSGLFCHPEPLPTPMGIPRLFVPCTYRRQGIASALLDAAAATFIRGCPIDPKLGQVAFTQPTGDGKAVMLKWGGSSMRIYEE